jgi:hypothetical protein
MHKNPKVFELKVQNLINLKGQQLFFKFLIHFNTVYCNVSSVNAHYPLPLPTHCRLFFRPFEKNIVFQKGVKTYNNLTICMWHSFTDIIQNLLSFCFRKRWKRLQTRDKKRVPYKWTPSIWVPAKWDPPTL